MLCNGIGQSGGFFDLIDRNHHLCRNLLVQLDILFKLTNHGAAQGLQVRFGFFGIINHFRLNLEEIIRGGELCDPGTLHAFDQHLYGAIGQFQKLKNGRDRSDIIDIIRLGIVFARILLGDQQDLFVILHHIFQGAHRFVATHKQRHDHMRENHNVAQWQDRQFHGGFEFLHNHSLHGAGSFRE